VRVDGNDVFAVDLASRGLLKKIRAGDGPRFLHAVTYRFKGHVSVDAAGYRDKDEVSRALESDPLLLAAGKISVSLATQIREESEAEVRAALKAAAEASLPAPEEAYKDIQDSGAGQWR
jgi:pyruvate dehydrogenase E1 component alpha subunit